ncbi:protein kinase [Chitinophaga pendula]|uniref:protein kinase domain-containing protein n=1 Tax=Chitinophaga TaxID=79328 RepID=UPI000BAFA030|nr:MULTISPECIES: protein kinase [Chitinophaga]ASZ13890.1 hypothetical protein CK934_24495 [Chitinophaga sp. MD30]UCJ08490.1 protein kinase [Chitinophaga pendula]
MKEVITGSDQIFTLAHYTIQPLQEYLADREIVSVVDDLYISVGERPANPGWILHVSVGRNQVNDMLNTLIPHLISHHIAFRIPKSIDILNAITLGILGTIKYGKILTVYTNSDAHAAKTASLLVALTTPYTPIPVPTDIHLQNCVYTRLGKYLPFQRPLTVIEEAKSLYNLVGEKMDNIQFEPYAFPPDTHWPFSAITSPRKPVAQKIIAGKYYPVSFLRQSLKGHVYLAKYMRGILPKSCVLKQAVAGVSTDEHGRDMRDRLTWQTAVLNQLAPLKIGPKVIDLFDDGLTRYLVMERVKGTTIKDFIAEIRKGRIWQDLALKERRLLIECAIKVVQSVQRIHEQGYVHRDLNSENFVIEKNGNIRILDFEMSYDLKKATPYPPYGGGSKGYMSPEQVAIMPPTIKEDVYSIGGLLIHFFTGLSPRLFDGLESAEIAKRLFFLTQDRRVIDLLITCQHFNGSMRPELGAILSILDQLKRAPQTIPAQEDSSNSVSSTLRYIQQYADQLLSYLPDGNQLPYNTLLSLPAYQTLCLLIDSFKIPVNEAEVNGDFDLRSVSTALLAGYAHDGTLNYTINAHLDRIVKDQHAKGYWTNKNPLTGKPEILMGLHQGIAGKLWILLAHQQLGYDYHYTIERGLQYLSNNLITQENVTGWPKKNGLPSPDMKGFSEGSLGISITFIKAFHQFNNKSHKQIVERVIFSLPEKLALSELSFDRGIIGLAHVHLQGYLVFRTEKWLERLNWTVAYLMTVFRFDEPIQNIEDLTDRLAFSALITQYKDI